MRYFTPYIHHVLVAVAGVALVSFSCWNKAMPLASVVAPTSATERSVAKDRAARSKGLPRPSVDEHMVHMVMVVNPNKWLLIVGD